MKKAPFKVIWDNGDCIDSIDCNSIEEAKDTALTILQCWIESEFSEWEDVQPTEEEKENFDYMIYNCYVEIVEYNKETKDYDECKVLTDNDYNSIGWISFEEKEN